MQKYAQNYCYLAPHWRVNALASMAVRLHIFLLRILILFYFEKCGTFSLGHVPVAVVLIGGFIRSGRKDDAPCRVCVCVSFVLYTDTFTCSFTSP